MWKFCGEKVKKLRLEKGYRKHHLKIKYGIDSPQLDRIEKGEIENPGAKIICMLCDALDVSPTQLFVNE